MASRRKPSVGRCVIVTWVDSGLSQTGDPEDDRVGIPAVCETHGRVLSCDPAPGLRLRKGMSNVVLRLATNSFGKGDSNADVFAIWWPAVVSVRVWDK